MFHDPLVILMAEDDEGHANLIKRNLKRAGVVNEIVHVKDGREALDFIHCQNGYANRTANGPLLVLLDIKMPRVDGVEALRQIKADKKTAKYPVIMLTTTDDPREVDKCYKLGCSVYITKPVEYEQFVEATRRLGLFLQIVKAPPEQE
jgi:CheY-like chemotaxis protein